MNYPRRHTRITYEGISFLAILAFIVLGSIMRQINLLVLLSGLMIAPFFFNWRISMKMVERLVWKRRLPDWAHAGSPLTVGWQIRNDRRHIPAWGIRIVDHLKGEGSDRKQTGKITMVARPLAPGGKLEVSYRCLLPQRGIYEFGPAEGSSAFPVGLIRSKVKLPEIQSIIVAPPLGKLTKAWNRISQTQREGEWSSQRRGNAVADEIYAIRQWQSGDNRRLIHWRSSAKRGELMVRQYDQRTDRQLIIVLDLHSGQSTDVDVEMALAFLTTVVSASANKRNRTSIGVFGDQYFVAGHRNRFTDTGIMQRLSTLQPADVTDVFRGITELNRLVGHRHAGLIVISTRSQQEAVQCESHFPANFDGHWIDVRKGNSQKYFLPAVDQSEQFVREFAGTHDASTGVAS